MRRIVSIVMCVCNADALEAAIQKAKIEEEVAAAEARRKAEKLEMLQKRAQAAILARKMKNQKK